MYINTDKRSQIVIRSDCTTVPTYCLFYILAQIWLHKLKSLCVMVSSCLFEKQNYVD
jgi:hypothetical protein